MTIDEELRSYRCPFTDLPATLISKLCWAVLTGWGGEIVPASRSNTVAEQVALDVSNVRRLLTFARARRPDVELIERAWASAHATDDFCIAVAFCLDEVGERAAERAEYREVRRRSAAVELDDDFEL